MLPSNPVGIVSHGCICTSHAYMRFPPRSSSTFSRSPGTQRGVKCFTNFGCFDWMTAVVSCAWLSLTMAGCIAWSVWVGSQTRFLLA
ncbi:hypothetical protein DL95DRAFT_110375 [Leptodontidium sp. 2 PMI_412]|nr:hypothetical protein DL95DRAFT_110375 [Leptodontidium sp. 2 PMI_412]